MLKPELEAYWNVYVNAFEEVTEPSCVGDCVTIRLSRKEAVEMRDNLKALLEHARTAGMSIVEKNRLKDSARYGEPHENDEPHSQAAVLAWLTNIANALPGEVQPDKPWPRR